MDLLKKNLFPAHLIESVIRRYIIGTQGNHQCLQGSGQPRPQGFLLDDFQNGGSSGEDPGKGWITWYKISKNLGDFYHVTF